MDQTFLYLVLCVEACPWILQKLSQSPCLFLQGIKYNKIIKVVRAGLWMSLGLYILWPAVAKQVYPNAETAAPGEVLNNIIFGYSASLLFR